MNGFLLSGAALGILGSLHCVGMCGPLALALPVHHKATVQKYTSIFLYNLGRAITYALMGVAFGILGKSFSVFQTQQAISVVAGILMLILVLYSFLWHKNVVLFPRWEQGIRKALQHVLQGEKHTYHFLLIGLLNGFLPCGLVYIALAASIAAGSVAYSSLYMFVFGVSTFPVMISIMLLGKFISISLRNKLNKAMPYMLGLVAILLILRGLNLGIPYISPKDEGHKKTCCHS